MSGGVEVRAVVFDLGGVIFPSPLDSFREFERAHGLPHRFLSEIVLADPEHGAWSRLERGELSPAEFETAFAAECAAAGHAVDAASLMASLGSFEARPQMVRAVHAIRARGLRTGALTNNWPAEGDRGGEDGKTSVRSIVDHLFDTVVESAVEGLRKPDRRIYEVVCERLEVHPIQTVFLDDLGTNLKPAREMGMTTIKVAHPDDALTELAAVLGFPLD